MSRIFLTSDLHLGHDFVKFLRHFASDEEQIDALRDSWSAVTKRDSVYLLGDLCLGRLDRALDVMESLPGKKHLVLGNHDAGHPARPKSRTALKRYARAFESVESVSQLSFENTHYLLSHFPYDGEGGRHLPERYSQWRLRDYGVPLLHGHIHSQQKFSRSAQGSPQYHVGWDAWGGPVLLSDVLDSDGASGIMTP